MTTDELTALAQLEAKATKGPWAISDEREDGERYVKFPNGLDGTVLDETDAEFIAAMRNALPVLIQSAQTLEQVRTLASDDYGHEFDICVCGYCELRRKLLAVLA